MPTGRKSEAIWNVKQERWIIKVQMDGERRSFYSSLPGRKGKHEAEGKADNWLETLSAKDVRFSVAWERYLDYIKKSNGSANYQNLVSIGKVWLLPSLGIKKVSKLTDNNFQMCILNAAGEGKSRRTCANIRTTIINFCKHAKSCRLPIHAPEGLSIPHSARSGERSILQPGDLKTLFSKDYVIKYRKESKDFFIHAYRFSVLRGLRRGELCGLQREDVEGDLIYIQRAINRLGEETPGKNENAQRYVVLSDLARGVLAEQEKMLKERGIISPWIFPDENGERLAPRHFYTCWANYRKTHGIAVSLHELRHTFISLMKYEMPIEMLKDIVGHSVSMDTIGVYGHEVEGDRKMAANIMDDVFSRLLKT